MNLNNFWPWKEFRRLEAELAHKDSEIRMHRDTICSLEQQLGDHVKLNAEKDRHMRKLGAILAMSKGIAVLFLMCVNCFAQPLERQTWTTNRIPLTPLLGNWDTGNPAFSFSRSSGSGAQNAQLGLRDGNLVFDYHLTGFGFVDALYLNRDGLGVFANDNISARIFDQSNNIVVSVLETSAGTELELVQGSLQVTGPITNGFLNPNQFVATDANNQLVSTLNGNSLTNVQDYWTNDFPDGLFGLVSNFSTITHPVSVYFDNVSNGTHTAPTNTTYWFEGILRTRNQPTDFVNIDVTDDGTTNKLPAGLFVQMVPGGNGQVSEFTTYGCYNKNSTTNKPSGTGSGWLYGANAVFGFLSQSLASPSGTGFGANVGAAGYSNGTQPQSAGVTGTSSANANNQTNIGISGSIQMNGFTGGAYIAGYYEAQAAAAGAVDPSNLVSTVLMVDNRDTGLPILTLRSNSVQVAQVDAAGNAVFAQRAVATNGFASYATNIVTVIASAGFTNDVTHGFGTNNMIVDLISVGETVAFYNRSGANGQTSCGTLLFTDTGIANKEYNVGVNCGVAFSVGTFTSGTARAF